MRAGGLAFTWRPLGVCNALEERWPRRGLFGDQHKDPELESRSAPSVSGTTVPRLNLLLRPAVKIVDMVDENAAVPAKARACSRPPHARQRPLWNVQVAGRLRRSVGRAVPARARRSLDTLVHMLSFRRLILATAIQHERGLRYWGGSKIAQRKIDPRRARPVVQRSP